MFKKLKEKLKLLQVKLEQQRCAREFRFKCKRKVAYGLLRDKVIQYVCRLDANSESAQLPSSHKADVILQNIIKRNGDIFRYNKRFPFRLVHQKWEELEECYSI